MHGNSNEWCADWYGDYPTEPMADPLGPDSGTDRVVRGGGWEYYARHCRTAHRNYVGPGSFNYGDFGNIGFRIARSSVPQQQPVAE
jgi:formylglycine-generating enzyme required for sulfatase activity